MRAPRVVAGVVLAAGASSRLGAPKQLLRDATDETLVARAARQLREAGCDPVLVITGARGVEVAAALAHLAVTVVHNANWSEGMSSSIRLAVETLEASSARPDAISAMLIASCDMPAVTAEHLRALLNESDGGERRVASQYGVDSGALVRGIPAIFPRSDWRALHALTGDRGARDLLKLPETLSVSLRNGNFDLDTPADVAAWRATHPDNPLSSPHMSSQIAQIALADLDHEVAQTRRMLSLVPADKLDFTPHAKSWPLGKLARHLTDFGMWGTITLTTDVLNFADPFPPMPPAPTDAAGFVKMLDDGMEGFKAELAKATDEQLMGTWTMKNGDAVIMAMPRVAVLRGFVISHMIHHRAQLSIYYRLLDIPLPGLYGPSADDAAMK
jgi:CTP:molybdopterin cytidylyltransferase MocA/uncharacterized damage-inducible protein DinB